MSASSGESDFLELVLIRMLRFLESAPCCNLIRIIFMLSVDVSNVCACVSVSVCGLFVLQVPFSQILYAINGKFVALVKVPEDEVSSLCKSSSFSWCHIVKIQLFSDRVVENVYT